MPELDEGLFKEFMEFVSAKQQSEANAAADEEEVEIWDKEGRGARQAFRRKAIPTVPRY